jgi:hypothetical protein
MSNIFQKMLEISVKIGNITNAHLYDNDFINIEGESYEGKKFSLTLHIKEDNEND